MAREGSDHRRSLTWLSFHRVPLAVCGEQTGGFGAGVGSPGKRLLPWSRWESVDRTRVGAVDRVKNGQIQHVFGDPKRRKRLNKKELHLSDSFELGHQPSADFRLQLVH